MIKLSIITINYNNATGLRKTIESVVNQNPQEFEYIIIDGGSTDKSVTVLNECSHLVNHWISEKDQGVYDAMNKGISIAKGEYLMFLNSGDILSDKTVLDYCINHILKHPEVAIFYGDIYGIDDTIPTPWIHKHPAALDLMFLKTNNINHQSSLIKASLFEKYGVYPTEYKLAADHWLYLKCLVNNETFFYIDYPLIIYNYEGASAKQRDKYVKEMEEMWNKEVPNHLQKLCDEIIDFNRYKSMRLVKSAIKIHQLYNKFRS